MVPCFLYLLVVFRFSFIFILTNVQMCNQIQRLIKNLDLGDPINIVIIIPLQFSKKIYMKIKHDCELIQNKPYATHSLGFRTDQKLQKIQKAHQVLMNLNLNISDKKSAVIQQTFYEQRFKTQPSEIKRKFSKQESKLKNGQGRKNLIKSGTENIVSWGIADYIEQLKKCETTNNFSKKKSKILDQINKQRRERISNRNNNMLKTIRREAGRNLFKQYNVRIAELAIPHTITQVLSIYQCISQFGVSNHQITNVASSCCCKNKDLERIFLKEKVKNPLTDEKLVLFENTYDILMDKIKNTFLKRFDRLEIFTKLLNQYRSRLQTHLINKVFPKIEKTEKSIIDRTQSYQSNRLTLGYYPDDSLHRRMIQLSHNNNTWIEGLERKYGECNLISKFQRQLYNNLENTQKRIYQESHKTDHLFS